MTKPTGCGPAEKQPVGHDIALASSRSNSSVLQGRAKAVGMDGRQPCGVRCRAARCGATGGGKKRSRRLMGLTGGRFGLRPAAWRPARAGRAAWAGRSPGRRWRRGGPPMRYRARANPRSHVPRRLAPGLRPQAGCGRAGDNRAGAELPDGIPIGHQRRRDDDLAARTRSPGCRYGRAWRRWRW